MYLSAAIDGLLYPNPPLSSSNGPERRFSFSDSDLFLQENVQVTKASTYATIVFSGIIASIATRNPVPFLIGFCGCLPRTHAQQRIGTEFQVNTYTNNYQDFASVISLSNGNFVVTWESFGQDGSGTGIYGQLFAGNGSKIRNEFLVNTYTNNPQHSLSVTSLRNDNFVVTWTSNVQDGSSGGVFGQLFDENGNKIRNEFQVNTYTADYQGQPSVASLQGGNFVVTWQSDGQDSTNTYGIFGQLFDGNGSKIGNEFQVNSNKNKDQRLPSVTGLSTSNFIVTWQSLNQDTTSSLGVFGQLFDGNATPIGNEFQVNTYILLDQLSPSVASFSNGNFLVIWTSDGQDGSGFGVYGQLFDGNSTKIGSEFRVNSYITNAQWYPSVTSFSNDNFVVTWTSGEIFGQLFDGNRSNIGAEFQVNTYTNSRQRSSSVASLSNGSFVITWTSDGQDGSIGGIFGQIFNDLLITTATSSSYTTSTTSTTIPDSSITTTSSSTSTTFIIPISSTSTFASSTRLFSSITSTTHANPSTSTTFPHLTTSTSPKTSSPKRTGLITWISLGVGGLFCFCVTPLGFLLLRKRKSQTATHSSDETGGSSTAFELKPIVQRHKVIGETYYQLSTLVREEAEEIYLQTGHLIPFPEGQKKLPYVIGSGQFGKIKVAHRIEDKQYVASKKVKGADNMRVSEAEAQMQKEAAGDNVLPIYNTIRLEDALYHFMPLAGLGDGIAIQRRLAILNQSPLALTILTFIAQNVLTGLQTIHAKGIDHLDIKPDNLVFTKDGIAYITDFGCAQRPENRHLTGKALGDNRYFSPERLRACREGTFDAKKADMWAAGGTLLQIFYNKGPLQLFNMPHRLDARVEKCDQAHFEEQLQRFFDEVEKGSIWWVIKGLLDTNPKTRLTAKQALQAHCFHGLDKTHQEHAFEELRRETFAQHQGIETSQVDLRDYGWVVSRAPEEERVEGYRSENYRQFYGYTLTPDFDSSNYQLTPEHVTVSSAASGYQLTP